MAKKFYKFVGKAADLEKEKMPLQQKQILRAMADLMKDKDSKVQGSQVVDHAKANFKLETRQKSAVLYAWYARDNEARGFVKKLEG